MNTINSIKSNFVVRPKLITTKGPDMSDKTIYFRSIKIQTKKSKKQIFQPDSTKRQMNLLKQTASNDPKIKELYIIREYLIDTKKYNLIFSKSDNSNTYKLKMISYQSNIEDFIFFYFDEDYKKYNNFNTINNISIEYTPTNDDTIYEGGPIEYSQSPIPIWSKTKIKDSVGLLTKILLLIFKINDNTEKQNTLLISQKLDAGFEPGDPYKYVISINDIDRDWGQFLNYFSGMGIKISAAAATFGTTTAFDEKLIKTDDKELIEIYVDEMVDLHKNNKIKEKYGGKRRKQKTTNKRKKTNKRKTIKRN